MLNFMVAIFAIATGIILSQLTPMIFLGFGLLTMQSKRFKEKKERVDA